VPAVEVVPEAFEVVPALLPPRPGLMGGLEGCGSSEQAIWRARANVLSATTCVVRERERGDLANERLFSFTGRLL
jgi:hypothetical protein